VIAEPDSEDLDDTEPTARTAPRWLAVTLAVIASGCFVVASFSHRWLANPRAGELGYSPTSYEVCTPACHAMSNFQVYETASKEPWPEDRVTAVFPAAGLIVLVAMLASAAGLIAACALALTGARPELPVSPTTIALVGIMIGLISGCVFVATRPGPPGAVGVAWSFWAFGIGSIAGIAGAPLLARQIRPADPDLLHDAMDADEF
jgi:hypothetical protein